MRILSALLLCLGLLVAVQAQAEDTHKPSDGLLSIEGLFDEMLEPEEPSVANSGHHKHHKHHWGHSHHHDDHDYWHSRHSAKAEFLHCAKHAVSLWKENEPETYKPAGEALAACIAANLHRCHDAPGLDVDFTKTVPYNLFIDGLEALAAQGSAGLLHAKTVFSFYLASKDKEGTCANRLYELLNKGCHSRSRNAAPNLARVLVSLVAEALFKKGQSLGADCVGDIPAIILAVSSTYCPESGTLYDPLTQADINCNLPPLAGAPNPAVKGPQYEDGPGALLAGSFISLLLLSDKPQIQTLGYSITFVANRYALATTQITDYLTCMRNTPAGLQARLSDIPQYSGPLGGQTHVGTNFKYGPQINAADFPLSEDGKRVLCASIAMVVGDKASWAQSPDEGFLLWQGSANIFIAVQQQVGLSLNNGGITPTQALGLCALGKAAYSFTTAVYTPGKDWNKQPATTQAWVTSPVPPTGLGALQPTEIDLSCITKSSTPVTCPAPAYPSWLSTSRKPYLATGHALGAAPGYCTPPVGR